VRRGATVQPVQLCNLSTNENLVRWMELVPSFRRGGRGDGQTDT
jgi:hypothetical protein